jgi:CubicO group peptidase (beta-lactamase class C family)
MRVLMLIPLMASVIVLSCSNADNTKPTIAHHKDTLVKYQPLPEDKKTLLKRNVALLYNQILAPSNFSGGIIVAKNGEILFEDYKGFNNYATKSENNASTVYHIASVSKTFTAVAILKLMEEGKLNITDLVSKYLPSFPYNTITIKDLLTHRSGLSNYAHVMDILKQETIRKRNRRGRWITYTRTIRDPNANKGFASNKEVLQFYAMHQPPLEAIPNKRFHYCNTNFVMLALIIESITGIDFPTYIKQNIFEPLGMKHSYIFTINDTNAYLPSYRGNYIPCRLERFDCVYGDKNVYTNPRDLLLWDKALFEGSIISKQALLMAYTPYSNEKPGTHNYGFGWRLFTYPDQIVPYHTGWWHGNNALFTRLLKDTATIIICGNRYNRQIYKAKQLAAAFSQFSDTTSVVE